MKTHTDELAAACDRSRLDDAAPELLAALRWFAGDQDPSDKGFDEWFEEARQVALAAIAKAEGRAE
jgi:hypothetical protein